MDLPLIQDIVGKSHQALMSGRVPPDVIPYLVEKRGVKENTMKLFEMGYCDAAYEREINHAFYDMESKTPVFPFPLHLQNKIIVPIKDDCGKLVAFATRGVGSGQKWWNTPFRKGDFMFGLNLSRSACFHKNKLVMIEGYMDVIVLFQQGLQWVGSPMGTRFSLVQAGLVLRYCERMCLCFDSDFPSNDGSLGPGQKAMKRILSDNNVKNLFQFTTIRLPIGVDPDEYVLSNNVASLLALETELKEIEDKQDGNSSSGWRD